MCLGFEVYFLGANPRLQDKRKTLFWNKKIFLKLFFHYFCQNQKNKG